MRQCLARDQKRPARVRSEDCVPLGNRNLVELHRFVIRTVVHQDVDATQFPYRFFDRGAHTLLDGDVALQGKGATPRSRKIDDCVLCLPRRTVKCNCNVGAGCRQRQRRSSPQPLRSSRDQHSFAEKRFVLCGLHVHDCIVLRSYPRSQANSSISSEPAQHIARTFFGWIYIQRDRTPQEEDWRDGRLARPSGTPDAPSIRQPTYQLPCSSTRRLLVTEKTLGTLLACISAICLSI